MVTAAKRVRGVGDDARLRHGGSTRARHGWRLGALGKRKEWQETMESTNILGMCSRSEFMAHTPETEAIS